MSFFKDLLISESIKKNRFTFLSQQSVGPDTEKALGNVAKAGLHNVHEYLNSARPCSLFFTCEVSMWILLIMLSVIFLNIMWL